LKWLSEIDDEAIEPPPRSALYALPFHGVGTPYAQSLTATSSSWLKTLVRTATMVRTLSAHATRKARSDDRHETIRSYRGATVSPWHRCLCAPSCRRDRGADQAIRSGAGTLLHLAPSSLGMGLAFCRLRAVVSACLLERFDGKAGAVPEPLLWSIACSSACAVHKIELSTSCSQCGKTNPSPSLPRISIAGVADRPRLAGVKVSTRNRARPLECRTTRLAERESRTSRANRTASELH